MKTLIGIISYNRPYEIKKKLGYWINEIKNADVKIFVCPDQLIYYQQSVNHEMLVSGVTQGEENGYIEQMIFMSNWAKENGYKYVLRCDDDMVFKANGFKKPQHAINIDNSIIEIEARFEANKELSAVSYSSPMEWLHSEKHGFKKRNKHFSGNCYIRSDRYHFKPDLYLHDDLFTWIELKQRGYGYCETYFGLYQDAILGKNEGGLQSFDRLKMSRETYKNALKYYPELKLKTDVDPEKLKHDIGKSIDSTYYKTI
jgi:hypothetical protein